MENYEGKKKWKWGNRIGWKNEIPNSGKAPKNKNVKRNQKCISYNEDLISDTEKEGEKNVGCASCPNWLNLKCTEFSSKTYDDLMKTFRVKYIK